MKRKPDKITYRGFPVRLHHTVPQWVEAGSLFHIRIAVAREERKMPLTAAPLAQALMDPARLYQTRRRWHITLFLLMPDHLHALLSFPIGNAMSRTIGDWKHFQTHTHGIVWQEGYFDHRLRNDERCDQLNAKAKYIRHNPVASGLCVKAEEWPWVIKRTE
jgi:putative transposase